MDLRRDFFNTTIDELEELVHSLEPSAEFNCTMPAENYYHQSMAIDEVFENITSIDDEDIGEDEN